MSGKQCEKKLWLEKHAKYLASPFTEKQKYIMQQGSKIGQMARKQYPDGILIKSIFIGNGIIKCLNIFSVFILVF